MNINTNLQPNDILNKEFHTKKLNGYNPDEVDGYLDNIIQDYDAMFKYIQQLEEENAQLKQNSSVNNVSQAQPVETPATPSFDDTTYSQPVVSEPVQPQPAPTVDNSYAPVDDTYPTTTNYDILRRLSNLERKVFGEEKNNTTAASDFYSNDN